MAESQSEQQDRVSAMAERLRRLQVELADRPPEVRRQAFKEVIEGATNGQPGGPGLLADLAVQLLAQSGPGAAPRSSGASAAGSAAIPAEVRAKLQVGEEEAIDPARLIDLCGVLADLAGSLDQVMWTAWSKNIAPRSSVKRSAPLLRSLSRYAVGDPEVPRAAVVADADAVKRLSAALIAAVGRAGRVFAQRHLQKYAVQAIAESAPPAGFMKNKEAACWQHYVKLMDGVEDDSINQEIVQLIAESVEQVLKGRMGSTGTSA